MYTLWLSRASRCANRPSIKCSRLETYEFRTHSSQIQSSGRRDPIRRYRPDGYMASSQYSESRGLLADCKECDVHGYSPTLERNSMWPKDSLFPSVFPPTCLIRTVPVLE